MLRWFEHAQIFHPKREWVTAPGDLGRPFEDVSFAASDGVRLSAWFFPADDGSPRSRFAMLVCHGNGGNISHRLDLCSSFLRTGVNVMLLDYRGYGHSEGKLSEEGTYLDVQAAHHWLRGRGFEPQNIIVFGESLGGAIACELALREQIGGLILQSTFTNIADIGAELFPWLPVRWLHTIKYDTWKKLPRIHVPVLVTHSRDDTLIHFHHAEKNFAAANEPKMFWETSGGHNYSNISDYDRCVEGIEKFLSRIEENAVKTHS
ncbi:MAG TPA: alpha/beta hydrolase [Verrucomicrobiae bacterium]|nr:alpha/beta hydrolase [Verrucomicrobiae bacterium]